MKSAVQIEEPSPVEPAPLTEEDLQNLKELQEQETSNTQEEMS